LTEQDAGLQVQEFFNGSLTRLLPRQL